MEILNLERVYDGFFKLYKVTLKTKNNKVLKWERLTSEDGVCAVVYNTVADEYIFIKQFRSGPLIYLTEIVAGLLDCGLSNKETMIKEIREEIGYEVDTIVELGSPVFMSPGKCGEMIHFYYVEVSKKITNGGGLEEDGEEIEIISVSKSEIKLLDINDGKTIIALQRLNLL